MEAKYRLSTTFKCASCADTLRLAGLFAGGLKGGTILSLEGPIGAGKTFFVKGLAIALGAKKLPVSASFNLMRTYTAGVPLACRGGTLSRRFATGNTAQRFPLPMALSTGLKIYHFDLFRVAPEEIENTGLEDYLGLEDGASALEWAGPARGILERFDFTELSFSLLGGDKRRVLALARGPESFRLVKKVKKAWQKK